MLNNVKSVQGYVEQAFKEVIDVTSSDSTRSFELIVHQVLLMLGVLNV